MRISFNPSNVEAILTPPDNKDILFDLAGHNIFARGVKFYGTDTWRPVIDNLTSDRADYSLSANLGRVLNLTKTPYNNTTTASSTPSASNIVICPTNTSYYSSLGIPDGGGGLLIRGNTGTAFDLWLHDTSNVWYKRTSTGAWKKMDAGNADYASNADTVDGYHASGLFTNLSSSGDSILSIAIGGTTKSLWQFQRVGSSQSWVNGRAGALLRETTASGYHSIWSMKTSSGSWEFGEYNTSGYYNVPLLTYITDANYNNKVNNYTYQIRFPLASGTVALTSNIPTTLKNPCSLTTFGVVYDGSVTKVVTPVNFVSLLSEGTSTITDGTMLITSYASNNGFADTNAVNTPYKRKAIHLWEYIKSKANAETKLIRFKNIDGKEVSYNGSSELDLRTGTYIAKLPYGFASWASGVTWGNTTGTSFASWNDSSGGSIDFRRDNPSSGKMSIKVDGRVYVNEGYNPVLSSEYNNGFWGIRTPDGGNDWIRTSNNGLIPYVSGGAGSGHSSLGTSSWYFSTAYIDNIYGNLIGSVDGYRILSDNKLLYKTEYTVDSPSDAWILIKLPAWNSLNEIVYIDGGGNNRFAHCVVYCGSRSRDIWGYQSNYNGAVVTKIGWVEADNGKFAVVAHIDSGITTLRVRGTTSLEIVKTSANTSAFSIGSNFFSSGTMMASADRVDGWHVIGGSKPFGGLSPIGTDGVMEVGRYLDFHYDNTTGIDYSTRLQVTGNHKNVVNLPSASGTLALTSLIPNKSSWNYDDRYVLKTGDTMSGQLTINTGNFGALVIQRNDDSNGASILFRGKSNVYGYIGFNNSAKDKQLQRWNVATNQVYTVLDTSSTYTKKSDDNKYDKGIINGTEITYVSNSDTVDGLHASQFVRSYSNEKNIPNDTKGNYTGMSTSLGITGDWWHIFSMAWNDEYRWNSLLAMPTLNRNGVYYRSGKDDNSTWGNWVKLLDAGNTYLSGSTVTINGTSATFSLSNHNHTSLYGVTRINFAADASDSCYIGTTVNSPSTHLDFYLSDDASQESYRWIFGDCNSAVGTKTIMELTPTNNASTALKLYGTYVSVQGHTHTWLSITDKIVASNEFNIVSSGYNNRMWFNYLPIDDRNKTATVTSYIMGNGNKGYASVVASSFVKNGGTESQLLRADGGVATFNWYGLDGQPTWLWGGNNQHTYYVYNPSNFNVYSALYLRSLGAKNCLTGRTQGYGNVYSYNTNASAYSGAPTMYTSVIGFGQGTAGTVEIAGGWCNTGLYWRSLRDCCDNWYSWRTVLDSSNYNSFHHLLTNGNTAVGKSTWTNPFSSYNSGNIQDGQAICVWGQYAKKYSTSEPFANDSGDISFWLKRESANMATLNIVIDGNYYSGTTRLAKTSEISNFITVNLHTTNNTNYPLVWSNLRNSDSVTGNLLFKSWAHLYYNPSLLRLYVTKLETTDITFPNSGTTLRGIQGTVGDNDFWRIKGGAAASNAGFLEIATADDGTEPIYVRLYTGVFSTVKRTLTLLDGNGFSYFPSYINIGGNENNNSSPDRVWGSNGSDTFLRSYRTSALNVSNADTVDNLHAYLLAVSEHYGNFTRTGRLNRSGFYQSYESTAGGNAPWTSWMHLINCQHSNNNNNYALQIAAGFYDNDTFRIRVTNNNVNNSWRDIITSSNWGSYIPNANNYYWANVKISTSSNTQTKPSVNTIYANNWFRSLNSTGWYSETYGGGIYMQDNTWIRTWGGKAFYCDNQIYSSNLIRGGSTYMGATNEIWSDYNLHIQHSGRGNHHVLMCCGGATGCVGIGTESPSTKLHVNGDSRFENTIYVAYEKTIRVSGTNIDRGAIYFNDLLSIGYGYCGAGKNIQLWGKNVNIYTGTTSSPVSHVFLTDGLYSKFHHKDMNSDNYLLLAGGGYRKYSGDSTHCVYLGVVTLSRGTGIANGYMTACDGNLYYYEYSRQDAIMAYCKIAFFGGIRIVAAMALVQQSGGSMTTWVGEHRGNGAWWLHCMVVSTTEVRVKGFCNSNTNNDSWWGGNPLGTVSGDADFINVILFGYIS